MSHFLLVRGAWLVLLEVTLVRFAWTFSVVPDFVFLQVIWVLGVSMIVLSALIRLPHRGVAAIGVGMIAFHNLLDGIRAEQFGQFGWLWSVMHEPAHLQAAWGVTVYPLYSLIPWVPPGSGSARSCCSSPRRGAGG